jgi:hypothetical protein
VGIDVQRTEWPAVSAVLLAGRVRLLEHENPEFATRSDGDVVYLEGPAKQVRHRDDGVEQHGKRLEGQQPPS